MLFGAILFASMTRFLVGGGVERAFVERTFFFHYWGFDWVRPLPAPAMHAHVAALAVLGAMIALGAFYRFAACAFFVGFTWMSLIDVTNYLNHYYLVSLLCFWCCVLPLHRTWSVDAWRRPALRSRTHPAWVTWALRAQIGVVYVFAGLAKLGSDWLWYGQPLGHWLASRADTPLIGPVVGVPAVALAMSWAGFVFDSTIVVWLSWARTRLAAYVLLVGFHTATGLLFNIGIFPFVMTLGALVFFPPSWPRRVLPAVFTARLARTEGASAAPESPAETWTRGRRIAAAGLAAFATLQLAVPLRHWVHPGNVLWTEEGMRWSWRVKVRAKRGSVVYRVTDVATGETTLVGPRRYLTPYQEEEMSGQPDLILQLAHHIARDFATRGVARVEVRADTAASLNGRPPAPLIDPTVDLVSVRDGLTTAAWILPAPSQPPPRPAR